MNHDVSRIAKSLSTALLSSLVVVMLTGVSLADEPRDDGFYSPDDWNQAPWLQRVATGQAGFYRNCDDDSAKRYSPYIQWTCKPQGLNAWPPRMTLSTLACDFDRKVQRHLWGQGGCAPCTDCNNPPGPASLLRLPPELRPQQMSVRHDHR